MAMCYNPALVCNKALGDLHMWNWSIRGHVSYLTDSPPATRIELCSSLDIVTACQLRRGSERWRSFDNHDSRRENRWGSKNVLLVLDQSGTKQNLVAKILATKFGFVPDCWYMFSPSAKKSKQILNKKNVHFNNNTILHMCITQQNHFFAEILPPWLMSNQCWINIIHDNIMTWKCFPHYWPFMWGSNDHWCGFPTQRASNAELILFVVR